MKKSLFSLLTFLTIAITNNTIHSLPQADQKKQANNDIKAMQLTKNIQTKMESAQNASNPAEQQRLKNELKNDIEKTATYFNSVQNFFGHGPIAEKRREQAEKQKTILENKLFLEKKHFKTLHNDADKEKSLKRQEKLQNQIHTEKIALGQAWSWKQKALAAALTGATAYVGYQYGGQAVSTAKGWLGSKMPKPGEPTDAEMMAAYPSTAPETPIVLETADTASLITPEPNNILAEDSQSITNFADESNWKYDFINAEVKADSSWGQWLQDQAYYYYNLLPSLRSTPTNE